MIYDVVQILQADTEVLKSWFTGKKVPDVKDEDQEHRIQVAAARCFAAFAMSLAALWTLSILTFVVTLPLKIACHLAVAVALYAAAHDVFVMSHNASHTDFRDEVKAHLYGLFKGHEVNEKDRALEFTRGTLLQPAWMWLYVHRHG